MTLFQEIELFAEEGVTVPWPAAQTQLPLAGPVRAGRIVAVEPGSVAAAVGIRPGDELLAVNNHPVQDVIDVQYYSAEEALSLLVQREGENLLFETIRDYMQPLGLEFAHPTFDTDIRRCNNLCEFCFVLQMAPRFRRTLYIKDDDYRYSFLFGHFVTLTNLSEHDWWRIANMGLSPLYVSVHVTDLDLRRKFLRNESAPDIMDQLRWLAGHDIEMHTQLVVVPEFNDGPWLERSIADLAALYPAVQSISVAPVGLTRQHKYNMRAHTPAEAAATLDYVQSLQPTYQEQFGLRFVYPTDEWFLVSGREIPPLAYYDGQDLYENGLGMVRRFLDAWAEERGEIDRGRGMGDGGPGTGDRGRRTADGGPQSEIRNPKSITLVTGTLFAPVLAGVAAEFEAAAGIKMAVLPVVNERLGETITAAGLLMGADVLRQLPAAGYGDLVVLPRVMFDHPDTISLDDMTPAGIAQELDRPVALADTMGDVWDAIQGVSPVMVHP